MSNLHWREKIRKVTELVEKGEQVPEASKRIGLGCFIGIMIVSVLFLLVITIGLFQSGFTFAALLIMLICVFLCFVVYNILKAEKLP